MLIEEVFVFLDWCWVEGMLCIVALFFLLFMGVMVEGFELELYDGIIIGVIVEWGE